MDEEFYTLVSNIDTCSWFDYCGKIFLDHPRREELLEARKFYADDLFDENLTTYVQNTYSHI